MTDHLKDAEAAITNLRAVPGSDADRLHSAVYHLIELEKLRSRTPRAEERQEPPNWYCSSCNEQVCDGMPCPVCGRRLLRRGADPRKEEPRPSEPVAEVSNETVLAIVNANSGHGPIDIDDAMRIARAGVLHGRASRDVEVELFLKATEDREQERREARKEATDLLTTVDQLRAELAERERRIRVLTEEHDAIDAQRLGRISELDAELAESSRKYHELLFQVGSVFPGETRHETALRYLRAAESNAGSGIVIPAELRTEGKGVT